jgi:hypothetical protein
MLARACLYVLIFYSATVSAQVIPSHFKSVSHTTLSILWFDIYKAELFTPAGIYNGFEGPLILKLNYLRNISQDDLLSETKKNILKFTKQPQAALWLKKLKAIWPAIEKGDQLACWIDVQGAGHFFFNDRWIGSIDNPAFSSAFVQIWLSKNSSYPKLAKQLRGELNNEISK